MSETTVVLQQLLGQLRNGRHTARQELVGHAYQRLEVLTRAQLRGFRRADDTGDVLHSALLDLDRALRSVCPDSPAQFYALAAKHIRWTLLDGIARRRPAADPPDAADSADGPATRAERADLRERLHRAVEALPDETRAVVDLLYYHGLTQVEAAQVLGVSDRTVKKRWRDARLALSGTLGGVAVAAVAARHESG